MSRCVRPVQARPSTTPAQYIHAFRRRYPHIRVLLPLPYRCFHLIIEFGPLHRRHRPLRPATVPPSSLTGEDATSCYFSLLK